jgi:hypothetical protein
MDSDNTQISTKGVPGFPQEEISIKKKKFCCGLACKLTRLYKLATNDQSIIYDENDLKACYDKFDQMKKQSE